MLLLSRVDYHTIMDQAPVLYLIAIIALIAVLAMGHTRFGAKRWLPILGGLLQVSELVKLIIIVVLARFFSEVRTEELSLADLIKATALMGLPLALIMLQPDLGTCLLPACCCLLLPVCRRGGRGLGLRGSPARSSPGSSSSTASPPTRRAAYGGEFGQRCLLARRLVEAGVRFVEVAHNLNFLNGTGWDTHNQGQLQQHELIAELDRALSALIDDLERAGRLDSTLVVVATEFGRPAAVRLRRRPRPSVHRLQRPARRRRPPHRPGHRRHRRPGQDDRRPTRLDPRLPRHDLRRPRHQPRQGARRPPAGPCRSPTTAPRSPSSSVESRGPSWAALLWGRGSTARATAIIA